MDGGSIEAGGYQSVSTGERIHLSAGRINGIVLEQRGITADTALRLTRIFGNSAQCWMNVQNR
jgi:addiction module HigA family antidote